MSAQLQLIPYSDPLEKQIEAIRQLMAERCSEYAVTLGFFKPKRGPEYLNVMVVMKDKRGKAFTRTFPAASVAHMLQQINEMISSIKPPLEYESSVNQPQSHHSPRRS